MDDIRQELEQLFQGKIVDMMMTSHAVHDTIHSLGNYSPVNTVFRSPSATIQFTLYTEMPMDHSRMDNLFNGVSNMIRVTSVQHNCVPPIITYNVVCTVFDLDRFSSDMKDFQWKRFNTEFTEQLEGKLDKQDI